MMCATRPLSACLGARLVALGLVALGACAPNATTAKLARLDEKDGRGGPTSGTPRGLGIPEVLNRSDFAYAVAFARTSADIAFVHHVTNNIELTLAPDGTGYSAHAHVTGRAELAAKAEAQELGLAADRALERLARALRRVHDKRVFSRRRAAMQQNPKRPRR